MLKEERISLNTAKLLKEKGFAEYGYGNYVEYIKTNRSENPAFRTIKGEVEFSNSYFRNGDQMSDFSDENYIQYSAPTQSLVQKWLRETHEILVVPVFSYNDDPHYCLHIEEIKKMRTDENSVLISGIDFGTTSFGTYEEALEFGIYYALNLIP
jgi:hypothetical protein